MQPWVLSLHWGEQLSPIGRRIRSFVCLCQLPTFSEYLKCFDTTVLELRRELYNLASRSFKSRCRSKHDISITSLALTSFFWDLQKVDWPGRLSRRIRVSCCRGPPRSVTWRNHCTTLPPQVQLLDCGDLNSYSSPGKRLLSPLPTCIIESQEVATT